MQDAGTIGEGHRPLRDKVVEELRRRIVNGGYAPGDRLTEDRLAEAFGVSRNPVREAIRVLEAEGFVVAQPRRSAVVAT
ncbi:MAG: GntR family transcriptional regulator, partial [Natronosporangium sp.]